ncbi:MAG: SusC/RagA family TonB-linked outer membrane protein [Adhaeribacter sp.]|nr:SusC/RagA family TonB-linked outer membrane protein [Adhaeribacter sp.]
MEIILPQKLTNPYSKVMLTTSRSWISHFVFALIVLVNASSTAMAQQTISGRVIGASDNASLPGVTVVVKGSNVGTTTDADGKYTITMPAGQDVLTYTFIGYTPQDIAVGNRTTINVTLREDAKALNEVVVVGYGTQRREEVTSAVTSVKAEEFRQSGARNAMDLIQGKVAGLTVTRSGSNPNSGVALQIRGVNSLRGDQGPLVVIDGIPGGNLDLLQQDDIESIDVLKDGSAAAIYGTRANGGVILVTTKKGKAGPPRFDYSTYFRKEYVRDRPEFLTTDEFRQKLAEGYNLGQDYGNSTDFFDELINHKNLSQYHNLALSGGSASTNYRASVYFQDLQGIAKENGRSQYGGRLSINQTGLKDRLTAQINLASNFNRANLLGGGGWESSLMRNPTLSVYNPDGTYYFEGTSTNEVARLEQETSHRQQQTSSIDAKFTLELIKGLRASIFGAIQRDSRLDGAYRTLASEFSLENDVLKGGGYASRSTYLSNNYTVEPTVEYNRNIADVHHINAVGGYSYQYFVEENFSANNYGFVNDIFEENNLGSGSTLGPPRGMGSGKGDNTLIAYFGRVNYSFADKYMLSLILRREGSSRFGENNKWGNFPAVSVGWNIANEDFMQSINAISLLKLRVGYGVTGNQGIPNYSSLVTLGGGGLYLYPDNVWRQTYGPERNPNPDLRWEKKKEINIGLDFSLLDNRFGGALDVYQRRVEDLLDDYTSQLPPFVRENIFTNVGTIRNRGIELTLSATAIKKQDFGWSIDFAGSTATNVMESFSNEIFKADFREYGSIGGFGALGNAIRTFEGGKLGNFYGKKFAGFDENGQWLFYKRDGSKVPFNQINTGSNLETTDLVVLGNGIPKYYTSLTNNLSYKNFDLRIFLRGRFGYDILNTMDISYGNQISKTNLLKSAFDKHAQVKGTYQYSDYYLESGSFLKLDEVTFSYNFNLRNDFIRNLRIYATGANLATFTKYTGNDPDYVGDTGLGAGIDSRGPYPNTRSFLLGLNVGF